MKILESNIKDILLEENPGGVYIKELKNEYEYSREIKKIVKLLTKDISESNFIEKVFELFSDEFEETGKTQRYNIIAKKIWDIYIKS